MMLPIRRVCLLLTCFAPPVLAGAEVQSQLLTACDPYCPKQEVSGEIQIVGSTTMQQLAALWADGFQQIHPLVRIKIDCRGSETAIPGLASDQAVIGLMSRLLTEKEQQRLERKLGGRVVALTVCHDVLGVIVHEDNPLQGLTWDSEGDLLCGPDGSSIAKTWGGLGLPGEWSDAPLRIHGPTLQSGTRNHVGRLLAGSEPGGRDMIEHASHADLIRAVSADRGGLGLISLSRGVPEDVRLVPVRVSDQAYVPPTEEAIAARRYPLMRSLSVVLALAGETLEEPLHAEFIAYVLSRCGQQDVVKDGFLPLNRSELHVQEEKLGWNRLQ